MKVLHINCNYIGTKLHRRMAEHLNDFGVKSTVYIPVCEKEKEDVTTQNCEVIVSKCFRKWHRFLFHYKQNRIFRDVQEKCNISEYDCVHAYTLFTDGNCARRLSKKYKIPYVVAIRDTDVNVFLKKVFFLRKRAIRIMLDASEVFFLSDNYKTQVLEQYVPEKYRAQIYERSLVIPNGIDDFWFLNKNAPKKLQFENSEDKHLKIICAGVIGRRKNHMATQEALQILREEGWSVDYTIVGKVLDDALYDKIMSYPHTTHIPHQSVENLLDYYRQSDLFVMPSHTETFGLVYAEAMSQGLPVLYTRGQGFDGQFPDGTVGYAVDDYDPQEIAKRIVDVAEHYQEMSAQCIKLVDKFRWSDICEQYKKIYESIVKRRN